MKQTSMRLISQIDDKDKALMEKVFLFLTAAIPQGQKPKQKYKRLSPIVERLGSLNLREFTQQELDEDPRLNYLMR